jgi:hypothetical protein
MSRTLVLWLFFVSNLFDIVQSCSKNQCLAFGKDVTRKFQHSLAEEGVRIIYFKLDLSFSDSYKSAHPDRIMANRWTWAPSNREPLLSLSYDYDVLSLSLLKKQAKDITLQFNVTQSQCLKALKSPCQDLQVARALLDATNTSPNKTFNAMGNGVVCFRILRDHWFGIGSHFKYQCCKENVDSSGNSIINCNVPVIESKWLAVFNAILAILVGVAFLYWPLIFRMLPNILLSDENLCEPGNQLESGTLRMVSANPTSNDIPLDDYSPITLQNFLRKLGDEYLTNILDIRLKLFLIWFGFIPILFYTKLFLYSIIKGIHFNSTSRKLLFQVADFYLFVFNVKRPLVYVFFVIPFLVIPYLAIFLVPNEIHYRSSIEANDKSSRKIKLNLASIAGVCFRFFNSILGHSKIAIFSNSTCGKKFMASLYSIAYIILVLPICMIAVLMFLVASVVSLAIFSPYFVFLYRLIRSNEFSILHRMLFIYSTVSATILVTFSCQFVVRMVGFVIMGIILNAEFVVPYITFAFVVSNNIYLCFCNTQIKYKEFKQIVAEESQEQGDTIPRQLFMFVSKNVLPISDEIFLLLFKIVAIVVFLSIALTAILLFEVAYGASAIVSTISVFISGKFSEKFFAGITSESSFVGWERIRLKERIKKAVEEYMKEYRGPDIPMLTNNVSSETAETTEL